MENNMYIDTNVTYDDFLMEWKILVNVTVHVCELNSYFGLSNIWLYLLYLQWNYFFLRDKGWKSQYYVYGME